ncbi:MAG: VIT family protein [Gammaproteobacteria bacterium]|nr:VIT family protein [Gammaproteobacteria bacterium]
MYIEHRERHLIKRIGWLRAAVLGANDGIISTSSLLIGVATAHTSYRGILVAGIAGLIAGAMSMAAGEYISVSSQADTEKADLKREKMELETDAASELKELASIYVKRGLELSLAKQVASQLMAHDALGAHARDELGISEILIARPYQAAFSSAFSFTGGALLPLLVTIITPTFYLVPILSIMTILFLAMLGGLASKAGGSSMKTGSFRVALWGSIAMLISAGIGSFLGIAI